MSNFDIRHRKCFALHPLATFILLMRIAELIMYNYNADTERFASTDQTWNSSRFVFFLCRSPHRNSIDVRCPHIALLRLVCRWVSTNSVR